MKKLSIILGVFAITIFTIIIVKSVQFNQNCSGYLKRAANANTIELAKKELDKAIVFVEHNNIMSGYTSVLWKTPDEDIAFWYTNLKACQAELTNINSTFSTLEQTNLLMKLRESLVTDGGKNGEQLICPDGISKYPNNSLWFILTGMASISLIASIILILIWFDREYNEKI